MRNSEVQSLAVELQTANNNLREEVSESVLLHWPSLWMVHLIRHFVFPYQVIKGESVISSLRDELDVSSQKFLDQVGSTLPQFKSNPTLLKIAFTSAKNSTTAAAILNAAYHSLFCFHLLVICLNNYELQQRNSWHRLLVPSINRQQLLWESRIVVPSFFNSPEHHMCANKPYYCRLVLCC